MKSVLAMIRLAYLLENRYFLLCKYINPRFSIIREFNHADMYKY